MNQTEKVSQIKSQKGPLLEKEHGYFNSVTIRLSPAEVFELCQDDGNVQKVLSDLPMDVENFLALDLISAENVGADQYKIIWENKSDTKIAGNLTFLLTEAPVDRGTILSAEADFRNFNFNDDSPSTLMNIFLKRFKALMETGEIATTKGQPSGREELNESRDQTLH